MTCPRCHGERAYQYDSNHSKVCEVCCPHDRGWWLLRRHYGDDNGKYACTLGCGVTKWPEELGVEVPDSLPASCDRSPKGGDGVAGSIEDESAVPSESEGDAQTLPPLPHPKDTPS